MGDKKTSLRGSLIRELVADINAAALGQSAMSIKKHSAEQIWICPKGYSNEKIEREHMLMEHLKPDGVVTKRVILQLHGGGYIGSMRNAYRRFAVRYSEKARGADVLTIDYRVAPEFPYPAALDDALEAYNWLLERGYTPNNIVVAGDSAGGGLGLALCLFLRDHRMPMPAGLIAMSAWTDLTNSSQSYETNYTTDPVFGNSMDNMLYHSTYVGEDDPRNPYISPMFGDYHGFPPMLMQVGSDEVLLDDTVIVAKKARKEGTKVRLSIYEGMFHDFQMAGDLMPESKKAWEEVERFLEIVWKLKR